MKQRLNLQGDIRQIAFNNASETERVCNLLSKNYIDCIGQLCLQTKKDLRSISKIGDATIKVIENALAESGLRLGMTPDELNEYESCKTKFPPEFTNMDDLMNFVASRNKLVSMKPVCLFGHHETIEDIEDDDEDYETPTINLELNVNLPQEKEVTSEPNWDDRFYEIAKEEFFRQCRLTTCEETRAERAVIAAKIFIEAVKNAINENHQPEK